MPLRKPFPTAATFLTLIGLAVLCSLGTWQVKRLHWKQGLLAEIAAERQIEPMNRELFAVDFRDQNSQFRRGHIIGRYVADSTVAIGPRTHEGRPGYHIFSALRLSGGGGSVLVNRGWVPQEMKDFTTAEGFADIIGAIRSPEKPNAFVPQNLPEKNEWYRLDLAQIAQARGLNDLLPSTFYVEREIPPVSDYPLAAATAPQLPNNHFAYAIFWFSMAAVMLAVYVLRFFVSSKDA